MFPSKLKRTVMLSYLTYKHFWEKRERKGDKDDPKVLQDVLCGPRGSEQRRSTYESCQDFYPQLVLVTPGQRNTWGETWLISKTKGAMKRETANHKSQASSSSGYSQHPLKSEGGLGKTLSTWTTALISPPPGPKHPMWTIMHCLSLITWVDASKIASLKKYFHSLITWKNRYISVDHEII